MPEEKTTLTSDMGSNEPKYYIVNLSTVNSLKSRLSVFSAFADLHYKYSDVWWRWIPFSNIIWTGYIYKQKGLDKLIDEYKLGNIDTKKFTDDLLVHFHFLENKVEHPAQVLGEAWNTLITWNQKSKDRLNALISLNRPVYFISNSNELNLHKIIEFFNESSTGRQWDQPPPNEKMDDPRPVELSQGFYLAVSYVYGLFKDGTPGLVSKLSEFFTEKGIELKDVELVSQYGKDLETAGELGFRTARADEFFASLAIKENQQASQQAQQTEEAPLSSSTPKVEHRPNIITPPGGLFNRAPASSNISAGDEEPQLQSSSSSSKKIN